MQTTFKGSFKFAKQKNDKLNIARAEKPVEETRTNRLDND